MKKAIAYARYSSDNQTENSIEAQVDAITEYCKKNKIDLDHVYVDRAELGRSVDRDDFQKMMFRVQQEKYDYIIFHKSDRLARIRIEPIISESTFLKAQTKIGLRTKPRTDGQRHYLLTGKIKCSCGSHFVGNQYGSGKYKYYWYNCTNKKIAWVATLEK